MSITSPEKSISFTDEQTARLGEYTSKLRNLETEIIICNKDIDTNKKEILQLTKEKMYQEELLKQVSAKVEETKKELADTKELVINESASLDKIKSELISTAQSVTAKNAELEQRESAVAIFESNAQDIFNKNQEDAKTIADEKLLVEKAKQAFVDATLSVTWK